MSRPVQQASELIESLETRRLLAASLSGTVLKVGATNGDDDLSIAQKASTIIVNLNGKTSKFSAAKVNAIRINARDGDDTINLGAGVSRRSIINAGAGNDTITGGAGADRVNAGEGADLVRAGGGNDSISGGDGNDRLVGQGGDDLLSGEAGNDKLSGGSADDLLYGGADDDNLIGGNGRDTLGGDNEDQLNFWKSDYAPPLAGNDRLDGGAGDDWLLGSHETNEDLYDDDSAAKPINTNNGRDTLIGGAGNDVIDARGDDAAPDKTGGDIVPSDVYHNNGVPIPDHDPGEDPYHFHGHVVLRVIVDGKKVEFPVGVGEFGVTMIHRHYAVENGAPGDDDHKETWHLHALKPHTFTLKEIFHTAGVSFSDKNIGQHRVTDGATLTMRVKYFDEDGAFQTIKGNFADYAIKSTDVDAGGRTEFIEIRYTSR